MEDLPTETLLSICEHLPFDSILSLRLSFKRFYEITKDDSIHFWKLWRYDPKTTTIELSNDQQLETIKKARQKFENKLHMLYYDNSSGSFSSSEISLYTQRGLFILDWSTWQGSGFAKYKTVEEMLRHAFSFCVLPSKRMRINNRPIEEFVNMYYKPY
jgi:hypothetical protein